MVWDELLRVDYLVASLLGGQIGIINNNNNNNNLYLKRVTQSNGKDLP